eukprot:m.229964 g.229964  ORF g.229964 m.229964 type:complete len:233 (-) comp11986_c0_seq1:49-747(-)
MARIPQRAYRSAELCLWHGGEFSQRVKMASNIAAVVLVVVCAAGFASAACDCKDAPDINAGNCTVKIRVCGCLHHFPPKLQYQGTATETHSGKSAKSDWHSSDKGAGEQAVLQLFDSVLGPGTCNCQTYPYKLGNCTLKFDVCFMFNDTTTLEDKKISYRAWCTDAAHNRQGYVEKYADPMNAATASAKALVAKYPDEPKVCGLGQSHRAWTPARLEHDVEALLARRSQARP